MQAVILAGGRGARLGDLTDEIPKPMIPVGHKPLLHHQVDLLAKYGIKDIILLVHYLKEQVISYFGDGAESGVSVTYYEEKSPLGTAGGIKEIADRLTDDFMVLYGDVMISMDLSRLIRFHREKRSQCTLVLHPNDHPYDSDLVETNHEGRVTAFHPKPHDPGVYYHNLVNAGAYILSADILSFLEKGKKTDFGRDIFPSIYHRIRMFGYTTSEYLKDMGTPDRLEKATRDLEKGLIQKKSYEHPQKAVFLDRDGVLNIEKSYISRPEELEIYPFAPAAVRKINHSGRLAVVVTNQSAVARNLCTEEDVDHIHRKLETDMGKQQAWLDAIYYCPHHPDKGYPDENPAYKIDCECRKPKTGMFVRAAEKYHIALEESYMIGDSERDVLAGRNAGCITVGVRTGYGIRTTRVLPDYFFKDLAEAVDFILEEPYAEVFENVYRKFVRFRDRKPFIMLIGGNSRSGKSTLASFLNIGFRKKGLRSVILELDNWIIPEKERLPGMNVYDRFRLADIEKDVESLLEGSELSMDTYANHPDREPVPVKLNINGEDTVIIEGIVALSSAGIRKRAHVRIFTGVPENILRDRIEEYYTWRGKSPDDIEELYEKRKDDEYRLIEKERNLADLIINPAGI
ncbi:MAG: HAD-IIIA family hydrolase [Bacteroidales bacterium]|nr:HAD-IIIA family hydrolase [Bacteroidales bacterium]